MQIGFIGLGQIGHPMATNLSKAGFALVVNDLARERADALVAAGATWADDARAVAEAADVVITSIPGPPEVKAVFEGERGLLAGIRAGATWIEMSTTDVDQLRAFAGRLEEKGAKTLDSPVTGGVDNAWLGKVTIFVGGEREEFERRRSVFEGIGDVVHYMGPLGSGMTTKLITNMLGFNHQVAMGEALMLGKRAGLDLVALRAAAQTSTGASAVIERDGPFVFDGTYLRSHLHPRPRVQGLEPAAGACPRRRRAARGLERGRGHVPAGAEPLRRRQGPALHDQADRGRDRHRSPRAGATGRACRGALDG